MFSFDKARTATAYDRNIRTSHAVEAGILSYVGSRWRVREIPSFGTVLTDPGLIAQLIAKNEKQVNPSTLATPKEHRLCAGAGTFAELYKTPVGPALRDLVIAGFEGEQLREIFDTESVENGTWDVVSLVRKHWLQVLWNALGFATADGGRESPLVVLDRVLTSRAWVREAPDMKKANESSLLFLSFLLRERGDAPYSESGLLSVASKATVDEGLELMSKDLLLNMVSLAEAVIPRIVRLVTESGVTFVELAAYSDVELRTVIHNAFSVVTPFPVFRLKSGVEVPFDGVKKVIEPGEVVTCSPREGFKHEVPVFTPTSSLPFGVEELLVASPVFSEVFEPSVVAYVRQLSLWATDQDASLWLSIPSRHGSLPRLQELSFQRQSN